MSTRFLATCLLAFAGIAFAFQGPTAQLKPTNKPVSIQSLSRAAKLRAVKTKFPKITATGLYNSATLTTRIPFIANTAWVNMLYPRATVPNEDSTKFEVKDWKTGHGALVFFNVKKPNKAHLVTFYFKAADNGTMYASNGGQDVNEISDSQKVMAGQGSLLIAFVPASAGEYHFLLDSKDIDFFFNKVEIDVVD